MLEIRDTFPVDRCDYVVSPKVGLCGCGVADNVANHTNWRLGIPDNTQYRAVRMSRHHGSDAESREQVNACMNQNWRNERFAPFVEQRQQQPQEECISA